MALTNNIYIYLELELLRSSRRWFLSYLTTNWVNPSNSTMWCTALGTTVGKGLTSSRSIYFNSWWRWGSSSSTRSYRDSIRIMMPWTETGTSRSWRGMALDSILWGWYVNDRTVWSWWQGRSGTKSPLLRGIMESRRMTHYCQRYLMLWWRRSSGTGQK